MENALYNNTVYYVTVKKAYTNEIYKYEFVNDQSLSEFKNTLLHNIQRDYGMEFYYLIDVDYHSIHGITHVPSEGAPPITYLNIMRKIKINLLNNDTKEFYFYLVPIPNVDDCGCCNLGLPQMNTITNDLCRRCFQVGNNLGYRNCDYCNSPLYP
jgi:hypothetical protein